MDAWDKLRNQLAGAIAQVNPLDNGRTYGDINRPKQPVRTRLVGRSPITMAPRRMSFMQEAAPWIKGQPAPSLPSVPNNGPIAAPGLRTGNFTQSRGLRMGDAELPSILPQMNEQSGLNPQGNTWGVRGMPLRSAVAPMEMDAIPGQGFFQDRGAARGAARLQGGIDVESLEQRLRRLIGL